MLLDSETITTGGNFMAAVCLQKCAADATCKGITIDEGEQTCHKHTSLPWMHGVMCGGSCDGDKASCSNQVCLAKGADATGVAHYIDIGAGACAPALPEEEFAVLETTPWPASGL